MQLTKHRKVVAVILAIGGAFGTVVAVLSNIQTLGSFIAPPLRPYVVVVPAICFVFALLVIRHSDAPVDGVLYRENVGHRRRIEELETQLQDVALRLTDDDASVESQLKQMRDEGDAIHAEIERYKTDVEQHVSAIQTLTTDNTALRSAITLVMSSDLKIAKRNLEVSNTLRNRVLLLVAELREIPDRITISTHYEHPSVERMHGHQRQELGKQMLHMHNAPIWRQYWEIYHADFDRRVGALINDLQQVGAASDKLIAFPETVGSDELDHSLPMSIEDYLIPELLSAADAVTRIQSS